MSQQYERLQERERRLLQISTGVVALLFIATVFFWANGILSSKQERIETTQKQLEEISALESRYRKARAAQDAQDRRFRFNDVTLFSYLQGAATRLGLQLSDLNEQRNTLPEGGLVEISVLVNLKELSMDKLTAMLETIEETAPGGVVKVTKLKVKNRFDTPDLLDAQLTVSTWKMQ